LIAGPGATHNVVTNNYIGTDVDGSTAVQNAVGVMNVNAPGNTIGGLGAGEGNLVSGGDGDGIDIIGPGSTDNLVAGNEVGTTVSGQARLGGATNGVCIINAPNNQVGGTTAAARNVISGSTRSGVVITGPAATGNRVEGNLIGTDSTGTFALGNGRNGVTIANGASGNLIGGIDARAANTIAFNGTSGTGSGVAVTSGLGNAILSNRIYANAGKEIALSPQSVTAGNAAPGAPLVRSASLTRGRLSIDGRLAASPGSRVLVQFFLSDPSRPGVGPTFLGGKTVTTGAGGRALFKASFRATGSAGRRVTATATVAGRGTSQYSTGVSVIRR
jgi:hypothetical protein